MGKYLVRLRQECVEEATIEVEASDLDKAEQMAINSSAPYSAWRLVEVESTYVHTIQKIEED